MISDLEHIRRQKDAYFKHSPDSPIPPDERAGFGGLRYYPENDALRFELAIDEFAAKEPITMTTSTGGVQDYLRWGAIRFEVEGQPAELTVYYASWGAYFVPFVDATSGQETYGAGRYLEPEDLGDGRVLVDFNLAYNPYCAYSEDYSCPIPPAENRLAVPIRAGEMAYAEH
jgi:uncharacterized protein (DUF1684 family)